MRHRHIRTIIFYIAHGIYYGAALGALCGTLILPWIGTMYAAAWGLGIGLAMGILAGFMVAIVNAIFYRTPYDLPLYRQRMTRLIGVVVAIGAGTLLVATTYGLLWGPYTNGFLPYFLPSLAGAVFWGGLSSAFATSIYADRYAISIHKQKNDIGNDNGIEGMLPLRRGIFQHYADRIVRPAWGLLAVVVGCVLLAYWSARVSYGYYNSVDLIGVAIQGALAGTIGSFVLVCTAYFLTSFVVRVFLTTHDMDYETLRQRLGAVQWVVTGFFALASLVFASQFLAGPLGLPMMTVIPVATLAGWWMTRDFATWYLTPPEAKPKHA
jgi:hypothetical protein